MRIAPLNHDGNVIRVVPEVVVVIGRVFLDDTSGAGPRKFVDEGMAVQAAQ